MSGQHYNNRNSRFFKNVRDNSALDVTQKIRLTKNHINKITNTYINNIVSYSPGVTIIPKTDGELHDKKDAELSLAVWQDIKYRHKYREHVRNLADDFCVLGEMWMKVTFDEGLGDLIGYADDGKGKPDKKRPILSGDYIFERFPGYDGFMDPAAKSISEARWIGFRKLVDKEELKKQLEAKYKGNELEEKIKLLQEDKDETYAVFQPANAQVFETKGKCFIKEFYYRPCKDLPLGWFVIKAVNGILFEGDLQLDKQGKAIFPIISQTFDTYHGSPRGYSGIKQIRPLQAEVNRCASKIAEHQIILGDDKVYTTMGGGISEGAKLPGVREVKIKAGMTPTVMQGRDGSQFVTTMESSISEMYRMRDVKEDSLGAKDVNPDIMSTLYRSLREKKPYVLYSEKFERFLVDWCDIVLRLAKANYRDEMIVRAVGKSEAINIAEFRESDDMAYSIKLEALSEDIESVMGKYLVTRDLLQYAGSSLTPEQLGVIASSGLPFIDKTALNPLTKKHKSLESLILQMDRGEEPVISQFDDNKRILETIVDRMNEDSFKYIVMKNPKIYDIYLSQYEERTNIQKQQLEELKNANMGIIPTGGVKVKVDAWIPDPKDPTGGKPMRAVMDQVTLEWLFDRLGKQGEEMMSLQQMPNQAQIDILGGGKPANNMDPNMAQEQPTMTGTGG